MEIARSLLVGIAAYDSTFVPLFAFFAVLELLFPREPAPGSIASRLRAKARDWLKAIAFWLVWVPFTVATVQLFMAFWSMLDVRPLIPELAPPGLPPLAAAVLGALAAAFVGDLFYYWCHRAQHRFFWRFHAVHHSVREMSGLAAYHHVTEQAFKLALYAVPLAFFTTDPYAVPVLGVLLGFHGNYLHSPIRLNFGPLGRVFQDNRSHRIHHSIEPKHFDKNFGVFTTLWDVLFGTAYFPAPGEWPATGVVDAPEPQSIGEFIWLPFRIPARPRLLPLKGLQEG
jgi:sterol desaturase/sphingolipid hydroxylase (fatty acid hydroxylase superfamily)